MFQSTKREIIVPQDEHARLAGHLAEHWGNREFGLPAIDRAALVAGVRWHDRGYGLLDTVPIVRAQPVDPKLARQYLEVHGRALRDEGNPAVNALVGMHIARILGKLDEQFASRVASYIAAMAKRAKLEMEVLSNADTITRFCDTIAFHFSFEDSLPPGGASIDVFAGDGRSRRISYAIEGPEIKIIPWPFNTSSISGSILAYEAGGYPDRREIVELPFKVAPHLGNL